MLLVLLSLAALVPLIVALELCWLGGRTSQPTGGRRNAVVAVTAALALLGASIAGGATAAGQGDDAERGERSDSSSEVVVQAFEVTVSGSVTDGSGNAIRDVSVIISRLSTGYTEWSSGTGWSSDGVAEATTDASGSYTLGPFAADGEFEPGEFARTPYYLVETSAPGDLYADEILPVVVESAGPIHLDIQLGAGGDISGRLRSISGETPGAMGVDLCTILTYPGVELPWSCRYANSDPSGNFEFSGLAAGTYAVHAYDLVSSEASVTLEEGGHARVDFEVVPYDYEFRGWVLDDEGSVHEAAIDALGQRGILTGTTCTAARICPSEGTSRAVMAVWLGRALTGHEPQSIEASRFAEVEVDGRPAFEAGHIERFADLGVTRGCMTGPLRYCPDTVVTRAEMATFLQRALNLDIPEEPAAFTDVDRDSVHASSIDALRSSGITLGCDSTRYCPDQPVARGEMATFIYRSLGLLEERQDVLEFDGAVVIDVDSRVEAELHAGGVSYFRFEVPEGGGFAGVETHGDLDLVATLRRVVPDALDEELSTDDDGGVDLNSRIALGGLAAGWYIVEVRGYSSNVAGQFEISVTLG